MKKIVLLLTALTLALCCAPCIAADTVTVTDGVGRQVTLPANPERVICSGPGCLRYLTYMQAQDRIVAVDDMEARRKTFDAKPYAMANPQFKKFPIFGEFRGHDNPELIISLEPQPQVIFKTFPTMGHDPVELEKKTGIPVVVLNYGDLGKYKANMFASLRTMGKALGKEKRAEEVVAFFENSIADLRKRVADIPESEQKTCFVGGIAHKGPHGFQSTQPHYPPFMYTAAKNVARDPEAKNKGRHADVAKEKIVEWNPDILFLDLSTLQLQGKASGYWELKNDSAYRQLKAVQQGEVYGVLPYNWYSVNFGSILADAYFVGSVLHPKRFGDIDPAKKADEIYSFLVGKPVFKDMDKSFRNMAFKKIDLSE